MTRFFDMSDDLRAAILRDADYDSTEYPLDGVLAGNEIVEMHNLVQAGLSTKEGDESKCEINARQLAILLAALADTGKRLPKRKPAQKVEKKEVCQYRFATATNPSGWTFVELSEDGKSFAKRLTKEMVTFDTTGRQDILVNEYGVVLFRERDTARFILRMPGKTVFKLREFDRMAQVRKRYKELVLEGKVAA